LNNTHQAMTTAVVFKKFTQEHLREIGRRKGYLIQDKKGSALAQAIADEVTMAGLQILFKCLTLKQLQELTKGITLDEKKSGSKSSLTKQLVTKVESRDGAHKLFSGLDKSAAKSIKDKLEITGKGSDASLLLEEAEAFGLENCFSTFDVDTLLSFAEGAGLKTDTRNTDALIDCLMEMKDFKPEKKTKKEKKPEPEKSKKKPEIKKGITEVDLQSWFNLEELTQYCQDQKIPHVGKKIIVIKRILKFLAGEDVSIKPKAPKKRKTPPSPKKSDRPTKKQKTGAGDASEEAMDTDKPKRGRPKKPVSEKKTETSEDAPKTPPKGRGRPKKVVESPKKEEKKDAPKKDTPKKGGKKASSSSTSSE